MTNAELLAKIKAEIERRKSLLTQHSKLTYDLILETFIKEYDDLLSFLSTLESEKPMNQDEVLNEEIKKEMAKLPFFIRGKDQIAFARHFAKWGADHTPLPEDTVLFQKGVAEGKRLMMEEAVEGEIQMRYSGSLCAKTIRAINEDKFKFGDKVRIVIVKED